MEPEHELPPVSKLEALAQPSAGLADADSLIEALRSATMRVAMVVRAGQSVGTAALVGPDLLLTAAHVLDSRSLPPSIVNVAAVFDFRPGQGTSPAETGIRIRVAEFLTGSLPSDSEVRVFVANGIGRQKCLLDGCGSGNVQFGRALWHGDSSQQRGDRRS